MSDYPVRQPCGPSSQLHTPLPGCEPSSRWLQLLTQYSRADRAPDPGARQGDGRRAGVQDVRARRRPRPQHGHGALPSRTASSSWEVCAKRRSELFLAQVFSDRGGGVRAPVVFYNRSNEAAAQLKAGDFDWAKIFEGGAQPPRPCSAHLPLLSDRPSPLLGQAAAGSTAVVSSLPSRPRRLTSSLRA